MPEAKWRGMSDFQRGIQSLMTRVPTDIIQLANNNSASLVAERARPKIPEVSGAAAASIQAVMTNLIGGVDSSGVDYYYWLEFGGASGRGHANVRELVPLGRYIYPTYEEVQDTINREAEEAVAAAVRLAGLEVN